MVLGPILKRLCTVDLTSQTLGTNVKRSQPWALPYGTEIVIRSQLCDLFTFLIYLLVEINELELNTLRRTTSWVGALVSRSNSNTNNETYGMRTVRLPDATGYPSALQFIRGPLMLDRRDGY